MHKTLLIIAVFLTTVSAEAGPFDLLKPPNPFAKPPLVPPLPPLPLPVPGGGGKDPVVDLIAPVIHLDPAVVKKATSPPSPADAAKMAQAQLRNHLKFAKQLSEAVASKDLRKVAVNQLQHDADLAFAEIESHRNQLALAAMLPGLSGSMIESPQVELVQQGATTGEPLYYVNGIWTSHQDAVAAAVAISQKFNRPVGLLYCPTIDHSTDLVNATYDRLWLYLPLIPGLGQQTRTTRQLAGLFSHHKGPLTIITHSRGCLIARNALIIANSYTGGKTAGNIHWVAAGMPLRDDEVFPKAAKFKALLNKDDLVSQLAGLNLDPNNLPYNANHAHEFISNYLTQISESDL